MTNKVRVKCPSCQATLQVNSDMCGKKINCPKCKMAMMLPSLQAFEPTLNSSTASSPATSGTTTHSTNSIWDDAGAFANNSQQTIKNSPNGGATQPNAPWGYEQSPSSYAPLSSYGGSQAYGAMNPGAMNPGAKTKTARSRKKSDTPLTEQESGLQVSGIFLIFVPLITTLLPLFGVQLKRLASLGNYAPIGGLFLGLIGSGIIVWARRKRSDAVMMGAIGAVCSLVFGIGGYSVLEFIDSQADVAMVDSVSPNAPTNTISPPSTPASPPSSSVTYTFGSEQGSPNSTVGSSLPTAPSGTAPSGTAQSSSVNAPNGITGNTASPRNNVSREKIKKDSEDAERFEQGFDNSFELSSIHGDGFLAGGMLSSFQSKKPVILNLVGSESFQCCAYIDRPVKGVCAFSTGMMIHMVPIEKKKESLKAAVVANDSEELHGLRFAFDGVKVVGYQGLLRPTNKGPITETPWYGRKTDDIKESINPEPGKTGFICFQNGSDFTGFGWVKL